MPNKHRNKTNKPKSKARSKKSGTPRYPTKPWGPSAQGALKELIPVFQTAWKRVMIPYYTAQQSISTTAGVIGTRFFSANGCFDPDISGVGHQPLGFDTMMLYYEQYTVVRSKISVTFSNKGIGSVRAAVSLTPDTTAPTFGTMVENGEVNMIPLDCPANSDGCGGKIGRIGQVNFDMDTPSYFGRKTHREVVDDPLLAGSAAANPTEQVYYAISIWDGFSTNNTSVFYDVVLEFDVIFWEPRKLSEQMEKEISILLAKEQRKKASEERKQATK